jgi:hypothetical protein
MKNRKFVGAQYIAPLHGVLAFLFLFLAACAPAPTATPDPLVNVSEIKLLATVVIPPTPGALEQQATQAALAALPTEVRPTAVPSPTPYIGVFMGDTAGSEDVPVFDQDRFLPPADVLLATPLPLSVCQFQPDARFGTAWQGVSIVASTLNCAGEDAAAYDGAAQVFEGGVMIFIPSGELWAIAPGTPSGRYWYAPQAPAGDTAGISAPDGLRVPAFGFGALWVSGEGVRSALGFARTDEQGATIIVQRFIGGTLIHDADTAQTFALLENAASGVVYGPF